MHPVVFGFVVSHGYNDPAMFPVPNADTGIFHRSDAHARIQAFPTRAQCSIEQDKPLSGLFCRALMHQLDTHGAGLDRLFDGEPEEIVWGTVVEATLTFILGKLIKGVDAVYEFGDFGASGWFRDALVIVVVGQRGQILC